jgi:hypothetical protein
MVHVMGWLLAVLDWRKPKKLSWGTRLDIRINQRCELCKVKGHTKEEHVRIPQEVLRQRNIMTS